ncbi:type I restriction enzyme, S subunit [Desulfomicrobium norvegicum]|uniref:Type I restriction enzyme, S subunit n=1 Tax=Desulfomicrobium norvegicum (strain DSM 1741 / NCIMB 8310) TaxID=52561 RepID=A0A8G2C6B0_DESNO|nr:restriction endonuclease subunit S [Desulfomicrobium norvegicum]SFM23424.1 type I restriction enzyme, S subunit [Desulfomicrobium norvegicum]
MGGDFVIECTVGEVAALSRNSLVGGPFGSNLVSSDYVPSGVPVIRGTNMGHGRWVDGEFAYVTPEKADELAANCAKRGDLVFTQRGTLGQVALVPQRGADRYLISQSQMKLTVDSKKADALFLYYIFTSPEQQAYIRQNAIQTGVPHTNLGILRNTPLTLPPLAEQKAIAAVLGALDDKIELNRRMNATLEAMARALFQSWFVDFDPVRAKLDGRQPVGMDEATAALFPDSFQDSEAGHIPNGWEPLRLPDAIEVNPRRLLKKGSVAPYLDMKNLPTQGHSAEEVIDRVFSSGTKFQNGDTLLARITPCLENGKTGYVDFLDDGQVGWGSTEYIVFTPKSPLPPQFGYLLARSDALRSHAIQNMTGTSGRQRVPSECFNTFWLAVPPSEVARRFDELTSPLMAKIKANSTESRTLATLRDTLLPKLLRGELSI